MHLNPTKCVFGIAGGKFLGFMLTHSGIKANPNKCSVVFSMRSPSCLKEVQSLVGKLTYLSRFLPRIAEKIISMVNALKKADKFTWSSECENSFEAVKEAVSLTPILEKPTPNSRLLLYISVSKRVVSRNQFILLGSIARS